MEYSQYGMIDYYAVYGYPLLLYTYFRSDELIARIRPVAAVVEALRIHASVVAIAQAQPA